MPNHSYLCIYCMCMFLMDQESYPSAKTVERGPMRLLRREEGELVGVWLTCREGGLSRREQLVGYLYMCPVRAWPTVWLL